VYIVKIGIIGDTHGSKSNLMLMARVFADVDFYIHTGDNWKDGQYLEELAQKPVLTVKGNCDWGEMSSELVFTVEKRIFYVTHGHLWGVKYGLTRLEYRAQELQADFCIFGHTHVPVIEYRDGITYLNPGSLTYPRSQEKYAGILMECREGIFNCQFMEI